jgi:hypothetical protein
MDKIPYGGLHNLYSSPNIIGRLRWTEHVIRNERVETCIQILRVEVHLLELSMDDKTILSLILNREDCDSD